MTRTGTPIYWSCMLLIGLALLPSLALASNNGFDTANGASDLPFNVKGQQIIDLTAAGISITGTASIATANGEGGTLQLKGNNDQNVYLESQNGIFRTVNSAWTLATFTVDQSGNTTTAGTLTTGGGIKVNAGGLVVAGQAPFPFAWETANYFGGSPEIFANGDNHTGGGIAVSDDGGFYDYNNDGYITYNGSAGLRIAGNNGPGSAGHLIVNGTAEIASFNGEGGVVKLDGQNSQTVWAENLNGVFRLLNSAWNLQTFSVDQSGNATVPGTLNVGAAAAVAGTMTVQGPAIFNSSITVGGRTYYPFGGSYQTHACDPSCRYPNPLTGACSCPPGYNAYGVNDFSCGAARSSGFYEGLGMQMYQCY